MSLRYIAMTGGGEKVRGFPYRFQFEHEQVEKDLAYLYVFPLPAWNSGTFCSVKLNREIKEEITMAQSKKDV